MQISEIEPVDIPAIKKLLKTYFYGSGRTRVQPNGRVNVNGDIFANVFANTDDKFDKLPINFNKVNGDFSCCRIGIVSLEGSPENVGGHFDCQKNNLTDLEGGPKSVTGYYNCSENPLTSLKGMPEYVGDLIYLSYSPSLPLMRTLGANRVLLKCDDLNHDIKQINEVLNKYAGKGKSAMMKCSSELLTLGKKLGLDLRQNARW